MKYGEERPNLERLLARESRRKVQETIDDEGYIRPLTSPVPRPHAGRKSKRTHARPWVTDPNRVLDA